MGSVTPYETANGRRYRVRYRKPDHSQTDKRGFRTKRSAEEFLATVELSKVRGAYIDPALSRVTLESWANEWMRGQVQLKPTTVVSYAHALRKHIVPKWGDRRINDISHAEIQAWVGELARVRAPQTVRNTYAVLSQVFSYAVRDGRLLRNPADGIQLPRRVKSTRAYLTHTQVHRLADESGQYGPLILFLAYTGLRWGEASALRIGDVDLVRRRIDVSRAVSEPAGRIVFGTPKTHARRSVPFPTFLVEPLATAISGRPSSELLFRSPEGDVIRAGNFRSRILSPALSRVQDGYLDADGAEVAGDPDFPRITPHDLRHTAASLAISAGANVKAIQGMLGHASATMTLDVYADLFPDDLDNVAAALDAAARAHLADAQISSARTSALRPA